MVDYTACKLVFPVGINKPMVIALLSKYTSDYSIANFYAEKEIGCNKIAFAVVDVPHNIIPQLFRDEAITGIELITSYNSASSKCGGCNPNL